MAIARTPPCWLADLAGAWIFYTVLPAWPWPPPRFRRIARFAPWIGLLIGSSQAALWWVLTELGWSPIALAPLVLAVGIWLSGGLHHDGLMDTADGLAAGVERRLIAMEDSRVGASGVLALVMLLLPIRKHVAPFCCFQPINCPQVSFLLYSSAADAGLSSICGKH